MGGLRDGDALHNREGAQRRLVARSVAGEGYPSHAAGGATVRVNAAVREIADAILVVTANATLGYLAESWALKP